MRASEMYSILFDSTEYYMECNKDFIEEGYNGYLLKETDNSQKVFVIYKDVGLKERKYIIPSYLLKSFQEKYSYFQDFFNKKLFLLKITKKIKDIYNKSKIQDIEFLRKISDSVYSVDKNYICFVALNLSKTQFFKVVQENIQKDIFDTKKYLN